MTDALSRREIEDVLSSIRRLVSHEVPPTAPFTPAQQAGSNRGNKLLLTSALRVDGPAAALKADADAASIGMAGPALGPQSDGARFDVVPDAPQSAAAASESLAPEFSAPDPAQTDITEAKAHAAQDVADPHFAAHVPSLLARISGARRRPEEEPDLSRPLAELGRFGTGPQMVDAPVPADSTASAGADVPKDTSAAESPAQSVEDSALETTLARLEELLAGAVRDETGTVVARDDADSAEDVIDEGVLYQLVAHIVRQELQGELGEKITRNIRKLVRAEVARELQLRQF